MKKILLLFIILYASYGSVLSQVTITVEVNQAGTTIGDCDGFLLGDSEPIFLGDAQDVPNIDGNGFSLTYQGFYQTTANGFPFGPIAPFQIFNVDYGCDNACFPTGIEVQWEGCENDGLSGTIGYICDGGTGNQFSTISIPTPVAFPAVNNSITNQTLIASSTGTGCDGDYQINVTISVSGSFLSPAPDAYCDAIPLAVGGAISKYAWCNNATFEALEPFGLAPSSAPTDMSNGSVWFYFVAPTSGSVYINTNLGATNIGTRFIVYHASNGGGCPSLFCLAPMQYLSYTDWSNVGGALGTGSQADLVMDCANVFAGSGGLIPGDTYYIQLSADDANVCGVIELQITDESGSGRPLYDVPCGASPIVLSTTVVSDANGDAPSLTLSKGCTYDDEIDSDFPHATPYDESIVNNNADASVWSSFVAPNSGSISIEANCNLSGEYFTLYTPNACIAPAIPNQYNCIDLTFDPLKGADGGIGATALQTFGCLEPGYTYYIMVDPDNINVCGALDLWVYDPVLPTPANDNLCLAAANPAYAIVVDAIGAAGIVSNGDNTNACREDLAGEPLRGAAAATVWYSFIAPASGVINLNMTPGSIGNVSYALFASNPENLNGTGCYGGLDGAIGTTYTTTQASDITIAPLFSSTTNSEETNTICCLVAGATYFIQVDGSSASSTGTFGVSIVEQEVTAGSITMINSSNFICPGDYIQFTTTGEVYPSCMSHGALVHNQGLTPTSAGIKAGTVYDVSSAGSSIYNVINDGSTTIPINTEIYASALVDGNAGSGFNFGDLCPSLKASAALPFVFLTPITFGSITQVDCNVSLPIAGGLPAYNTTYKYTYTITGPLPSTAVVASSTTHDSAALITFAATGAGVYTITASDSVLINGDRCEYSTTINVNSSCFDCLTMSPGNIQTTNPVLCPGSTIVFTLDGTQTVPSGGGIGFLVVDPITSKIIKKIFTTGITNNGTYPPGDYCIYNYANDGTSVSVSSDSLLANLIGTCFVVNPNCFLVTMLDQLDATITTTCPGSSQGGSEFNILNMTGGAKDASSTFDYTAFLTGIDVYGNAYSGPGVQINEGDNVAVWDIMEDGLYTIYLQDANFCQIDFEFISSNCQLVALANEHISLAGQAGYNSNSLQWISTKNENCVAYEILFSEDGLNYKTITTTIANATAGQARYDFEHTTLATGYYKIYATTKASNSLYSNTIYLKQSEPSASTLTLYPNPTTALVLLELPATNGVLQVVDVQGKVIYTASIPTTHGSIYSLATDTWAAGLYFVQWQSEGQTLTSKLIKR